jgi:hypothetical protein
MLQRHTAAGFWLAFGCLASGQTAVDLRTQGRSVDFTAAPFTKPFRMGTGLPASCTLGEAFFNAAAPAGQNLYGCTGANVWSPLSGSGLPGASSDGVVPIWNAAAGQWSAGLLTLRNITGITGQHGGAGVLQSFGGGTVATGDCARFDIDGNLVSAGAPCGSAGGAGNTPNYSQAFTGQTSITLAHNLASLNVVVQCYDNSNLSIGFENAAVIDANTAVVTFAAAQSGRCVVNGSGGGGGGGGNPALGGDLSGTAQNATVNRIAGRAISTAAPADQQVLQWSASSSQWLPAAPPLPVSSGVTAGPGVTVAGSQVAVDPATVLTSLTYSDSWPGATVSNATCSASRIISAAGAATGDRVAVGGTLPAGVFVIANVSGPGQLTYQVCNLSGSAAVLASSTYQFSIFRSF